ncbi:MAG: glycosyltransferase [Gammaproteobacteria bacterium]|nr:glycosyltransferase [Gammaproteobacteria bacterium]
MPAPEISVLMSVFNAAPFVGEAADSVLKQTFGDFEFLIVDDGSTDGSGAIIAGFAARDSRIRVLRNERNRGLSHCRNQLMREAAGAYLALMDADDICFATRLGAQKEFLDANPAVGIAGARAVMFSEAKERLWRVPLGDREIKSHLLLGPPLCHPSVMMRASTVRENRLIFNEDYLSAQDYLFWVDACPAVVMANLKTPLLRYRRHRRQLSGVNNETRIANHIKTAQKHLARFHIHPSAGAVRRFIWRRHYPCATMQELREVREVVDAILSIKNFYGYPGVAPSLRRKIRARYFLSWARLRSGSP